MMQKAFVAGATGYTGQEVVKELQHRGITTIAHVRPDSPRVDFWRDHFRELGADVDSTPWNPESMKATIKSLAPTLIFALLGTTKKRAAELKNKGGSTQDESYEKIDFGYTALLIDAGVELSIQPRFVYLSSLGVSEKSPGAYMRARWKTEEHLRKSPLAYTIIQPCFISGIDRQENRPLERMGAIIGDSALSVLSLIGGGKLKAKYESIDAKTLAGAMVRLGLDSAAENTIVTSESLR